MKPSELKTKSEKELRKMVEEKKSEYFALRLKRVTGQLAKTHQLKEVRKDLARIYTFLNAGVKEGKKEHGKATTKKG
ncbi:MAG: 50S ribosomal protein L29 [Deltaproteobacteria bacterium]|nr:50S ribosomal protein L29 [Deltaproteobacteria bacterium]